MSDYQETTNASAWGLPNVLRFFDQARTTSADVYPSEMHFLENCLQEGISVLDVGCAQGGFATVLSEHLADFSYTGVDISETMIDVAAEKHPTHQFYCCPEGDLSVLSNRQFDLVLVLGILHLHEAWRQTLAAAWAHTKNAIIFDLRLTRGLTIEDKSVSYFRMDFGGGGGAHDDVRLPYILLNENDAMAEVKALCPSAAQIERFGYIHPASSSAVTTANEIKTEAWMITR
ncbi:MAG: class I SAM-dependent methyltransferase [Proteobacteria bacterium]|nr:class I SAM-dependent methyltransferase [Pseudomonadota bacterium]